MMTIRCFLIAVAVVLLVLRGAIPSEAQTTGFGCYANYEDIGGLENWRAHVQLMKQVGMNTFALYYRDEVALQEQLDIAVEEGMLEQSIPVFIVSNAGPPVFQRILGEEKWAAVKAADLKPPPGFGPGEAYGVRAVVDAAQARARHADKWPELVAYNYDEPGGGNKDWDGHWAVRAVTQAHNANGFRCGTAVCWPHVKNLVDSLDILCVNLIIGGDLRGMKAAIQAAGKPFWVYDIHLRRMTPAAIRYHIGVWTWLVEPEVRLHWSWADFLGEQADMARPQMNNKLAAYAEGLKLYHRLRQAEHKMQLTREAFDWEGFPLKQFATPGTDWQTWEPPVEWFEVVP